MASKAAMVPMPTSATGTSSDSASSVTRTLVRTARLRPATIGGFTLLELLVVMVIVGILATMFTLSVGLVADEGRQIRDEGERLRALVQAASDEAVLLGREMGLRFLPDGYEFSLLDDVRQEWVVLSNDEFFHTRTWPEGLALELRLEGRDVALRDPRRDSEKDPYTPQIFIFSSGDLSPFEARLSGSMDAPVTILSVDVDGTLEITQSGS